MITIFKNEKVRAAYQDKESKEWRSYSEQEKDALDALATIIDAAQSLQDIRNIPPLHLEILKGKKADRRMERQGGRHEIPCHLHPVR